MLAGASLESIPNFSTHLPHVSPFSTSSNYRTEINFNQLSPTMPNNTSNNKRKRKMPPGTPSRKQSVVEGKRKAPFDTEDADYDGHPSSREAPEPLSEISAREAKRLRFSDPGPSSVKLNVLSKEERDSREFAVLERIRGRLHGSGRGVYLGEWMMMSAPMNPFDPDDDRLKQVNFPVDEIRYRNNLLCGMLDYITDKDNDIADAERLLLDLQAGTVDVRNINYPLPSYSSNWRELDDAQQCLQECMKSASGKEHVNVLQSYQLAEDWIIQVQDYQKELTKKLMEFWPDDVPFFKPLSEEERAVRDANHALELETRRLEDLMIQDPIRPTPLEVADEMQDSLSISNSRNPTSRRRNGANSESFTSSASSSAGSSEKENHPPVSRPISLGVRLQRENSRRLAQSRRRG